MKFLECILKFIIFIMLVSISWSVVTILIHIINYKYPGLSYWQTFPLYFLAGLIAQKIYQKFYAS